MPVNPLSWAIGFWLLAIGFWLLAHAFRLTTLFPSIFTELGIEARADARRLGAKVGTSAFQAQTFPCATSGRRPTPSHGSVPGTPRRGLPSARCRCRPTSRRALGEWCGQTARACCRRQRTLAPARAWSRGHRGLVRRASRSALRARTDRDGRRATRSDNCVIRACRRHGLPMACTILHRRSRGRQAVTPVTVTVFRTAGRVNICQRESILLSCGRRCDSAACLASDAAREVDARRMPGLPRHSGGRVSRAGLPGQRNQNWWSRVLLSGKGSAGLPGT